MNEMIKGRALSLLDEALEIAENIDIDDDGKATVEQINELQQLLNKIKTGVSKIK